MQRRRLGGLEVSAVGLGCARMTPFYDEPDWWGGNGAQFMPVAPRDKTGCRHSLSNRSSRRSSDPAGVEPVAEAISGCKERV
jgi:hypothetical protein